MAKVLVTGANGFLGSWLVRRLTRDGHEVRILARATSDLSELEGLTFEKAMGDITDPASLQKAVESVEAVFHLAGVIAYKASQRKLMEEVNVQGTANVLKAVENSSVKRLVYLSSVVAVGAGFTPDQVLNEDSSYNLDRLNLGYYQTKHEAEELVLAAARAGKVDAVCCNPGTVYGPGDAKKASRKTQLKVAQGLFHFYTKGGVNVIAVEDCVDGIIAAWKKGRSGERYILGGENVLIKDLFRMIAEAAHVPPPEHLLPPPVVFTLGWIGDRMTDLGFKKGLSVENAWSSQLYNWFDNTKAKRELGLNPRPAREAIESSVGWMREKGLL